MTRIWKKLNLRDGMEVVVVDPPASFEEELLALPAGCLARDLGAAPEPRFVLAFVTSRRQIREVAEAIVGKARGDSIVWFAYPKQSSRTLSCDFNRDSGWEPLWDAGFMAVRQVAIDDDWSALRFRRLEYIKGLQRKPKR